MSDHLEEFRKYYKEHGKAKTLFTFCEYIMEKPKEEFTTNDWAHIHGALMRIIFEMMKENNE